MWKTTLLHAIPLWNLWPSKLVRPINSQSFHISFVFSHNYHIVLAYLNSLPCLIGYLAPSTTHISEWLWVCDVPSLSSWQGGPLSVSLLSSSLLPQDVITASSFVTTCFWLYLLSPLTLSLKCFCLRKSSLIAQIHQFSLLLYIPSNQALLFLCSMYFSHS